jgi:2-hydroxy-3-oxopropionate reductase
MTRTGNTAAVIGLEVMGGPMAADLINAGYDVGGFNRSAGKVETHVARGGRGASSIAEAVEGADVVLTVLPDTRDIDLAVTGEDGVFAHAKHGALWIDSSTIRPDTSVRLASIGRGNGIRAWTLLARR